jgi:CDP-diacylglycerol--glycerol-3-phosphate 3-phosphatidyltransferase
MLSRVIGFYGGKARDALAAWLASYNPNPNVLTLLGFFVTVSVGVLFAQGRFLHAGLLLILTGALDILDGTVARVTRRVTAFGAFLDSAMDRYADLVLFIGLMVFYARPGPRQSITTVTVAAVALMGSVMTSYTRARAESLIPHCRIGFLERPERIVLLIIGALTEVPGAENSFFLHKMPAVLWVIAVLSHWTVAERMYHTWCHLKQMEAEEAVAAATELKSHPASASAAWSVGGPLRTRQETKQ